MLLSLSLLNLVNRSSQSCHREIKHWESFSTNLEASELFATISKTVIMSITHWIIVYYQWDDAFLVFLLLAHHGVWLSGPSLPIGKDTDVISLKGMQKHFLPYVFINLPLACKVHIFWLLKTREIILNVSRTAIMIIVDLKIAAGSCIRGRFTS